MNEPSHGLVFINDALKTAEMMTRKDDRINLYESIYLLYQSNFKYEKAKEILKYLEPPNILTNKDGMDVGAYNSINGTLKDYMKDGRSKRWQAQ